MICSISHKEMSPEVLLEYHQYHMKKQYNPLALNSAKKIFEAIKPEFEITGGCLISREKAVKDVNSRAEFCFLVGLSN